MRRNTLKYQILLPILILISSILGIYGHFNYSIRKNRMFFDLERSVSRSMERLEKNLSRVVYEMNEETVKSILLSELKKDIISSIIITDQESKKVIYGFTKDRNKNVVETKKINNLSSSPLVKRGKIMAPKSTNEKEIIGDYIIIIDDSNIKIRLTNEIISIVFTIIVLNSVIAFIIYFLLTKFVVGPLKEISDISLRVSRGDFTKRINKKYTVGRKNEILSLSKSMNNMTEKIEKLTTNLKNEVDSQTREIQLQNESFFGLLSNLDQGFLVLNSRGDITGDVTEVTKSIFNLDPKGYNVTDVFKLNLTEKKGYLKWIDHIFNGKMAFNDLLPLGKKNLDNIGGKNVELSYRPIYGKKGKRKVEKLICILRDVTKEKNVQKKIDFANEKSEMVLKLVDEPLEFLDILNEAQVLIDNFLTNKSHNFEAIFRDFHTLKARFANYKISVIVKRIHELETDIFSIMKIKKETSLSESQVERPLIFFKSNLNENYIKLKEDIEFKIYNLGEVLKEFLKENRKIIQMAQFSFNSGERFEELYDTKKEVLDFTEKIFKRFILKNIKDSFSQYTSVVKELSDSMGKDIDLVIGESNILVKLDLYKDFLSSLHHVFRNCVDHGIEEEKERVAQNKKPKAKIEVVFKRKGILFFQIAIKDDGRGIDPSEIKRIAKKREHLSKLNLSRMTPYEIIQIVFEPGFSSRDEASSISGRGIGMDAVKKCANDLEGKVWVESELGEGTIFVAELPILK